MSGLLAWASDFAWLLNRFRWCEARRADAPWRGQCKFRRGHRGDHENWSDDRWADPRRVSR